MSSSSLSGSGRDRPLAIIDVNVEIGPALELNADAAFDEVRTMATRRGIGTMLVRHRAARTISRQDGNRLALEAAAVDRRCLPVGTATTVAVDRLDQELQQLVRAGIRAVWVEGRGPWSLNTQVTIDLFSAAARTRLPLLVPCRDWGDAAAIGRMTEGLEASVILVGVHYMNYADIFAALRRYPHLGVDTSSIASFGGIDEFVRIIGAERVLFGSGMPLRTPLSPINAVVSARTTDAVKQRILAGNAADLLGIRVAPFALPNVERPARAFDVHGHFFPAPWEVPQPRDDEVLPELGRHGIEVRVASAVPALLGELERGNAQTVAACKAIPGQLGYLVADANDLDKSREVIRRWGTAPGIVGTKVHCVLSEQPTGSSAVRSLFRILADYGRPVKIHVGGDDWAAALKALASAHPRLPIIVAHGGPGRPLKGVIDVLAAADNVYVELASSVAELPQVTALGRSIDARRILFGTDAPLLEPSFILGTYQSLDLGPDVIDAVYWDNAAELFGYRRSSDVRSSGGAGSR